MSPMRIHVLALAAVAFAAEPLRPNIIQIVVDDMG